MKYIMTCRLCFLDNKAHSFSLIGNISGVKYFHTAPASATGLERGLQRFNGFSNHLPTEKWIWIFDCSGCAFSEFTDIGFVRALANELAEKHADLLLEIWIISPQWWLSAGLKIIQGVLSKPLLHKCVVKDRECLNLRKK